MMNRCVRIFAIALFAGYLSAQVANQTALVGTVTDGTGKAVTGAAVTALNTDTGNSLSTTTSDQGYYSFQFLRAGLYEITVQQPGFQTYKATKIRLDTDQTVRTDVALKIGEVKQTVLVEATAQAIKTDDASVSETITTPRSCR
jgi:Prophage tail fibre N-terminal.